MDVEPDPAEPSEKSEPREPQPPAEAEPEPAAPDEVGSERPDPVSSRNGSLASTRPSLASPRCPRTYEVETTVSRSHDDAVCSAHRLPSRGGSSVGQSSGLIIRRSQVQVLPAPLIEPAAQGHHSALRRGSWTSFEPAVSRPCPVSGSRSASRRSATRSRSAACMVAYDGVARIGPGAKPMVILPGFVGGVA
jgi:hypothetical protein